MRKRCRRATVWQQIGRHGQNHRPADSLGRLCQVQVFQVLRELLWLNCSKHVPERASLATVRSGMVGRCVLFPKWENVRMVNLDVTESFELHFSCYTSSQTSSHWSHWSDHRFFLDIDSCQFVLISCLVTLVTLNLLTALSLGLDTYLTIYYSIYIEIS